MPREGKKVRLKVGSRVQIVGPFHGQTAPGILRGLHGAIIDHGDDGTWRVRLDGRAAHICFMARNLKLATGAEAHRRSQPSRPRSHTILVIDRSGSMRKHDVRTETGGPPMSRHTAVFQALSKGLFEDQRGTATDEDGNSNL